MVVHEIPGPVSEDPSPGTGTLDWNCDCSDLVILFGYSEPEGSLVDLVLTTSPRPRKKVTVSEKDEFFI